MNLRDVADNILDYLSEDARFCWPCRRGVADDEPSRIRFEFETQGNYVEPLLGRFTSVLGVPFTFREEGKEGAPIVLAEQDADADAVVCFKEDVREDGKGLAYRIIFPRYEEVFRGWFSLCEEY